MKHADLEDLLQVALLLKDRELAALQKHAAAIGEIGAAETELAAEVACQRAYLAASLDGTTHRPGAFEAWMRHVRRQEAGLAAQREALSASRATQLERARLAFGRVRALEEIARRKAMTDRQSHTD